MAGTTVDKFFGNFMRIYSQAIIRPNFLELFCALDIFYNLIVYHLLETPVFAFYFYLHASLSALVLQATGLYSHLSELGSLEMQMAT